MQAIKNFCKAIHINPEECELWEEDLKWACTLRQEKLEKSRKKAKTLCKTENQESRLSSSSISSPESESSLPDRVKKESCMLRQEKVEDSKQICEILCKTASQSLSQNNKCTNEETCMLPPEKLENSNTMSETLCRTEDQESLPSSYSLASSSESLPPKNIMDEVTDLGSNEETNVRSYEGSISHRKENVQRQSDATRESRDLQ